MQQLAHTPTNSQHVPAGWGFPTLTAAVPPQPLAPVFGGGASADSTVTRVRWGRILLVVAGIVLVAYGAWSTTRGEAGAQKRADATVVGGGGTGGDATNEIDIARAARGDAAPKIPAAPKVPVAPKADAAVKASAAVKTPRRVAPRAGAPRATPRTPGRGGGGGRAVRPAAAAAAATAAAFAVAPNASAANVAPRALGGQPAGESLPVTGIETWIAAILGVLILAIGIGIHINAVRLGVTAMLYRRGLLLRPVDCARLLSQANGLARMRVAVSNLLHRLLEEPATRGEFVSARRSS